VTEVCDDTLDNDCDGKTDDHDEDCGACTPFETRSCETGLPGICATGTKTCNEQGSWGDCQPDTSPGTVTEVCNDQSDNDCDGWTDEGCYPPIFNATIVQDVTPIAIYFTPDQPLNTNPIVRFGKGTGTLETSDGTPIPLQTPVQISPVDNLCSTLPDAYSYRVNYTPGTSENTVTVLIDEGNPAIIEGNPGQGIAHFSLDSTEALRTSSFILFEGKAATGLLLDENCDTDVRVKIEAGDVADFGEGYNIVVIVAVDPGAFPVPPATNMIMFRRILCMISQTTGQKAQLAGNRTMTVTFAFELTDGSTRADYDSRLRILKIYHFDETIPPGPDSWTTEGTFFNYDTDVRWDAGNTSGTITFEADRFALFSLRGEQAPPCNPDETQSCYTAPPWTQDVGVCHAGTQTCNRCFWDSCEGQITPTSEICDGLDNNCNGQTDEGLEDCTVTNLDNGWNLISLIEQPVNTAIGEVLSAISGSYNSVWAFKNGSWKVYYPAYPGYSDLDTMETGWGYWINMLAATALPVSGPTSSDPILLEPGWNLVGFNSSETLAVADALQSIAGKYESVWAYINGRWKAYYPDYFEYSDLLVMEPRYGYWIKATEQCTWTMP